MALIYKMQLKINLEIQKINRTLVQNKAYGTKHKNHYQRNYL